MSAHHWIQGHCTKCGVKREKVRVQGPCFIPNVQPKLTEAQMTKAKEMAKEALNTTKPLVPLAGTQPDPHNIKHVVVATQSEPGTFQSEEPARLIAAIIQDAGREFGKVLYGGDTKPYNQNPLFEMVAQTRSIEPHKKRRAK